MRASQIRHDERARCLSQSPGRALRSRQYREIEDRISQIHVPKVGKENRGSLNRSTNLPTSKTNPIGVDQNGKRRSANPNMNRARDAMDAWRDEKIQSAKQSKKPKERRLPLQELKSKFSTAYWKLITCIETGGTDIEELERAMKQIGTELLQRYNDGVRVNRPNDMTMRIAINAAVSILVSYKNAFEGLNDRSNPNELDYILDEARLAVKEVKDTFFNFNNRDKVEISHALVQNIIKRDKTGEELSAHLSDVFNGRTQYKDEDGNEHPFKFSDHLLKFGLEKFKTEVSNILKADKLHLSYLNRDETKNRNRRDRRAQKKVTANDMLEPLKHSNSTGKAASSALSTKEYQNGADDASETSRIFETSHPLDAPNDALASASKTTPKRAVKTLSSSPFGVSPKKVMAMSPQPPKECVSNILPSSTSSLTVSKPSPSNEESKDLPPSSVQIVSKPSLSNDASKDMPPVSVLTVAAVKEKQPIKNVSWDLSNSLEHTSSPLYQQKVGMPETDRLSRTSTTTSLSVLHPQTPTSMLSRTPISSSQVRTPSSLSKFITPSRQKAVVLRDRLVKTATKSKNDTLTIQAARAQCRSERKTVIKRRQQTYDAEFQAEEEVRAAAEEVRAAAARKAAIMQKKSKVLEEEGVCLKEEEETLDVRLEESRIQWEQDEDHLQEFDKVSSEEQEAYAQDRIDSGLDPDVDETDLEQRDDKPDDPISQANRAVADETLDKYQMDSTNLFGNTIV